jgi:hypothetical protein
MGCARKSAAETTVIAFAGLKHFRDLVHDSRIETGDHIKGEKEKKWKDYRIPSAQRVISRLPARRNHCRSLEQTQTQFGVSRGMIRVTFRLSAVFNHGSIQFRESSLETNPQVFSD